MLEKKKSFHFTKLRKDAFPINIEQVSCGLADKIFTSVLLWIHVYQPQLHIQRYIPTWLHFPDRFWLTDHVDNQTFFTFHLQIRTSLLPPILNSHRKLKSSAYHFFNFWSPHRIKNLFKLVLYLGLSYHWNILMLLPYLKTNKQKTPETILNFSCS